jgi:hypothetical protein
MKTFARVLATVVLAASTALPLQARTIESYNVSGWRIGAYSNDRTGQFNHCSASVPYQNGVLLIFSIGWDYKWSMGLANPQWRLPRGSQHNLTYAIDAGAQVPAYGRAVLETLLEVELVDTRDLFERFRRGVRLNVQALGQRYVFNLANSSAALAATLDCTKKYAAAGGGPRPYAQPGAPVPPGPSGGPYGGPYGGGPDRGGPYGGGPYGGGPDRGGPYGGGPYGGGPDRGGPYGGGPYGGGPYGGPDRGQPPPGSPNRAANSAEAATLAQDVVASLGVPGFRVLTREQTPPALQKHDAIWTADGGITGIVNIEVAVPGLDQVASALTAADQRNCQGAFASARYPTDPGVQGARLMTACTGSSNPTHVGYSITPRPRGGFYVFAVLGGEDRSTAVHETALKVHEAAVRSAGRR